MLILIGLTLATIILAVWSIFSFSSSFISAIIPISLYIWIKYFNSKTGLYDEDFEEEFSIKKMFTYSCIAILISLLYLTNYPEIMFFIIIFSIILLLALAFYLFFSIAVFFDSEELKKIKASGIFGTDKLSGTLSKQKTVMWGVVLGVSLNIIFSSLIPEFYDPRIGKSIYLQKNSYDENEFKSEQERALYQGFNFELSSEIEKVQIFKQLNAVNPDKDFYHLQLEFWTEKEKIAQKEKLAEQEKQEKERDRAAKQREARYAEVRRRDGIYSQSQALSRCKGELRAKANSGYYMYMPEDQQRRQMTQQIDSCMYKYGYFGN
ncbi:MAG TPA: hypothetical protein QF851_02355 [Flavobacteriales bacterium]|nr:hypothetical protein [Flavobacteriales bacterium]